MRFVWGGSPDEKNVELTFKLNKPEECDKLEIWAADTYTVFGDGTLISYGPERCASGFARKRVIPVSKFKEITIKVLSFGIPNYSVDFQSPFVGFRFLADERVVLSTDDVSVAYIENARIRKMPRFSVQRGFSAGYNLFERGVQAVELYEVAAPVLLDGSEDVCDYLTYSFSLIGEDTFAGFDEFKTPRWYSNPNNLPTVDDLDIEAAVQRAIDEKWKEEIYALNAEKCGVLHFEINADEDGEALVVFEEITPDGKWIFRRANNNDFVYLKYPDGKCNITVSEPFAMRLLRVIHKGCAKITPTLIAVQNDRAGCVKVKGDARVEKVFEAARNTFMQNAVDIFMDCPGRERAGWLCDSYFTAIAELLFTGENKIEKAFLENILLAETPELTPGMLPMCFPAEHKNGRYIPNWAMWFVIQLEHRFERCGDRELVDRARDKVYGVINFFEKYRNEYGLLENLESWVFIEWSICNDDNYVCGVNYPSNMLYAYMLEKAAKLYSDDALKKEADEIRKAIKKLAFNGKFFVDNATRVDGKLKNCEDHLSETCQYYALFMGVECDENFKEMMKTEFGPLRVDAYPEVGRSNMFIGNYLRFFWLLSLGENKRVVDESLEYFAKMAEQTGTLWEHDRATASCNHGFASVAAVVLLKALVGYETVTDGKPVFNGKPLKGYDVNVEFNYR